MKSESVEISLAKHQILIVDDHPVWRAGLARIIQLDKEIRVCGEAANASEALKKIETLSPALAIVDLSMDGMNGMDLIKDIRIMHPKMRILVISTHKESIYAEASLKAGANGYIMKRENGENLLRAIKSVLEGRTYLSDEINQVILNKVVRPAFDNQEPDAILTNRELETFRLIGQGFGTRQIADTLHISMKTVEAHREHMRAKFGLSSNYQLVQKAIKWAHLESPPL